MTLRQVDQGGCFDPNPVAAPTALTDCRRNTIAIEDYLNIQQGINKIKLKKLESTREVKRFRFLRSVVIFISLFKVYLSEVAISCQALQANVHSQMM